MSDPYYAPGLRNPHYVRPANPGDEIVLALARGAILRCRPECQAPQWEHAPKRGPAVPSAQALQRLVREGLVALEPGTPPAPLWLLRATLTPDGRERGRTLMLREARGDRD